MTTILQWQKAAFTTAAGIQMSARLGTGAGNYGGMLLQDNTQTSMVDIDGIQLRDDGGFRCFKEVNPPLIGDPIYPTISAVNIKPASVALASARRYLNAEFDAFVNSFWHIGAVAGYANQFHREQVEVVSVIDNGSGFPRVTVNRALSGLGDFSVDYKNGDEILISEHLSNVNLDKKPNYSTISNLTIVDTLTCYFDVLDRVFISGSFTDTAYIYPVFDIIWELLITGVGSVRNRYIPRYVG